MTLRLRDTNEYSDQALAGFQSAGEAIEAVIRNGDKSSPDYGFHSLVAAAAYHLAHYSARAYSLLPTTVEAINLSQPEKLLFGIIKRSLWQVRIDCVYYLNDNLNSDQHLSRQLEQGEASIEDLYYVANTTTYFRAVARYLYALDTGRQDLFEEARAMLMDGIQLSVESEHVPLWWLNRLTEVLFVDLWAQSLHQRIPKVIGDPAPPEWAQLRTGYIHELNSRRAAEIELWPSQIDAVANALDPSSNLVLALPTGAGKTRIAELAILRTIADGKRAVYVSPLRALSAQVERTLGRTFNPLGKSVTSLYGAIGASSWDTTDFRSADIVIATPEKLDFALRNDPELLDNVGLIVLDEGHMIGLGSRQIRYEMLVQRLLRRSDANERRIVCLSAMLPSGDDLTSFVDWLSSGRERFALESTWRPTRQRYGIVTSSGDNYRLDMQVDSERPYIPRLLSPQAARWPRRTPFPTNDAELTLAAAWRFVDDGQSVLIYCPLRSSVEALGTMALKLMRQEYLAPIICAGPELEDACRVGSEWLGDEHVVMKCLRKGIALHHAGLPRPLIAALERLIGSRALNLIIASPTLAQGVNVTVGTIVIRSLFRAGERIPLDEFLNVCGRAGRPFVDIDGQIIFAAHGIDREAKRRAVQWRSITGEAHHRELKSGLVALVIDIIARLARVGIENPETVSEYILGMSLVNIENEEVRAAAQIETDLRWLDEAVLSLIGSDAECSSAELAQKLDDILHGSLWARQLARIDAERQQLYKSVLYGRAAVVWRDTTANQRRAYHLAGLDLHAGLFLDSIYNVLAPLLILAEEAFERYDEEAAISALMNIAELVVPSEYFEGDEETLFPQWREVMGQWLRGAPTSDIVRNCGNKAIDFIQDILAFRLVWAIEAVRARLLPEQHLSHGFSAVALESGTSNVAAALLLRSGLRSRVAAQIVAEFSQLHCNARADLELWLDSDEACSVEALVPWPTDESRLAWTAYIAAFRERHAWFFGNLESASATVEWLDTPGAAGSEVRLYEASRNEICVYSTELIKIGKLTGTVSARVARALLATVTEDQREITV
jgi:replicative superfamily II helicase